MNGALAGYRVVDLTEGIAGPYCTRLLAGLGAEVIKVEKPSKGDVTRNRGLFANNNPHSEHSLTSLFLNACKKSITLNLNGQAGYQILLDILKNADILIESYSPEEAQLLGLDYDKLAKVNPRLVMTSISGFGQYGPYKDYHDGEIAEYAMSGLMYITGDPELPPLKVGLDVAQMVAGQSALVPTLACVYDREFSRLGQHVDLSIMECNTALLELQWGQYSYTGYIPRRIGIANEKGHPWGILPCRDGWVVIASMHGNFKYLAELTGIPELLDPKFETGHGRIKNRDELDALLIPWLMGHDKEELYHMLQGLPGTSVGYVRNIEEIVQDPQLKHRQFFVEIDHPLVGKGLYPGAPYEMTKSPWRIGRAPLLGEHNEEIYVGYLGYSKERLEILRDNGIV